MTTSAERDHGGGTGELRLCYGDDTWCAPWGDASTFGTPSYWAEKTSEGDYGAKVKDMAASSDLVTETVFCLLGGYGVPFEIASEAWEVILPLVGTGTPSAGDLLEALSKPLPSGRRYRFPNQRSERIARCLQALSGGHPDPGDIPALKTYLRELPGIGPKTASWIIRNVTASPDVVIVDVWLVRALTAAGISKPDWDVARHYDRYETVLLQYCDAAGLSAAAVDLCIWEKAREAGAAAFSIPAGV